MMSSRIRGLAGKALVAAALGGTALGSAQATLVVGQWDPAFDTVNFPNLGWRASVTLDAFAACIYQPAADLPISSCPVTVVDARVEFYQLSDPLKLTLGSPIDFTSSIVFTRISIQSPGVVDGLQATTTPTLTTVGLSQFAGFPTTFELDLDYAPYGVTTLNWAIGAVDCLAHGAPCSGTNQGELTVTFRVPEPAGIALAGLGLLGLGVAGRRRRT